MEIGQKIIQQKTNIDELSPYILSIQVSLNGLSFCILNADTNTLAYYYDLDFNKRLNPEDVLGKMTALFDSEAMLQNKVKNVKVVYDNELSVLVPNALFNEDHLADYLKFNTRILQTDFITFDKVQANETVCVYVPYVNINNYLYEKFGSFEYKHFSTILIETILQLGKNVSSERMYVNINRSHFEIVVIHQNELKLYNTFEYTTSEDFIYYILFTAEQLQLNPEDFALELLGMVSKGDDLYNMAYKYVRHVSVHNPDHSYLLEEGVSNAIFNNFVLLNSL
jgi:hypothetical protein